MKIRTYKKTFIEKLTALYGNMEAESFFHLVLEDFKKLKRVDLALEPDLKFSPDELIQWNTVLELLLKEIPIQYILGKAHFYGLEFEVSPSVLIPRPETEELVDWILSENPTIQKSDNLKILDIGTGSGCIAISLAKNLPNAKVSAIDVSEKALEVAKRNAASNVVNVTFIQQNILETENLPQSFDIIVSNPPYVRNLEKEEIKNNVLENEPHLALFVDDHDALIFYRKIVELATKNLSKNGQLYFEINQYLAKETMDLLETSGFSHMELRKDIYGNNRMVFGRMGLVEF